MEIPRRLKDHLGLDQKRSWIIATDLNEFIWPGAHLFPIPGGRLEQYDYGTITQSLLSTLTRLIADLAAPDIHTLVRTEE